MPMERTIWRFRWFFSKLPVLSLVLLTHLSSSIIQWTHTCPPNIEIQRLNKCAVSRSSYFKIYKATCVASENHFLNKVKTRYEDNPLRPLLEICYALTDLFIFFNTISNIIVITLGIFYHLSWPESEFSNCLFFGCTVYTMLRATNRISGLPINFRSPGKLSNFWRFYQRERDVCEEM